MLQFCTYPKCNCPFDAPADPNWCARGLPHGPEILAPISPYSIEKTLLPTSAPKQLTPAEIQAEFNKGYRKEQS